MELLQAIFPLSSMGLTYSICNLLSIIFILSFIAGIIYMFVKKPKESK